MANVKLTNYKFFLTVFLFVNSVGGANILFIFGGANLSHKTGIWPLVIALANRGHNITFLSSTNKQPQTHINITDLAPKALIEKSKLVYNVDRLEVRRNREERKIYDMYNAISLSVCKLILNEPELKEMFENGSFELVVINGLYGECGFLIAHYFKSKYIISSSTYIFPWLYGVFGIDSEPSWIPDMTASYTFPMGLYDRMLNAYYAYFYSDRDSEYVAQMDSLMKERFNILNAPSFSEIEKNASLVLVNSHHTLDFARSLPPMFVDIGGMVLWESPGILPQDLQEYMDGAEEGVVLITFGSTMDLSTIPLEYRTMFFNMMKKHDKVRFIWRWASEIPENQPTNLRSSKWLPQREILEHPKTKAFVTHCGINGISEATYSGVPLVTMPFFGDQDLSSYRIVAQEVGVLLESRELTQEIMDSAFKEILTNPKYKKNMEARSKMFKDRPQSPTETGVYWTEFVLRHDDISSLKPVIRMTQSLFSRTLLDVYMMCLLLLILPFIILYALTMLVKNLI